MSKYPVLAVYRKIESIGKKVAYLCKAEVKAPSISPTAPIASQFTTHLHPVLR
jgi:hypothetical protein